MASGAAGAEAEAYRTIERALSAEIEVKRSRFLCDLVPLRGDEAEMRAREVIDSARKRHWDARHHCSAFVIGPDSRIRRSNDDGEPSGTAGAPMLDVLVGAQLTDVVAVVTRWFGGTLLGAGGLVRAYGDAVREAVATAEVVTYERRLLRSVQIPLGEVGRIEHALRAGGFTVTDVDYTSAAPRAHAVVEIAVAADRLGAVGESLAAITGGPVELGGEARTWVRVPARGHR